MSLMNPQIGYCTNVHAGASWIETWDNLRRHAVAVRQRLGGDRPMGVGLWLSAQSAEQLVAARQVDALCHWLAESHLIPYTFNGFPYCDFHQPHVKHRVYRPTWRQQPRRDYTLLLINILDRLLPPGAEGSISTLPIQWGTPAPTPEELDAAAGNLLDVARRLAQLEAESGRLIYVCLEPEPGCTLQRSDDVIRFYQDYLLRAGNESIVRRHLRVCHDVCHAVVMFESQEEVLWRYRRAGIEVGKMQLSSAVTIDFDELEGPRRREAVEQLRAFAEDRYLHQTSVRVDGRETFYDDLPQALDSIQDPATYLGRWRIHFHVPVYLQEFGHLRASREAIEQAVTVAESTHPRLRHFEVETYAWGVLPAHLQVPELADGIAAEMKWFQETWSRLRMCEMNAAASDAPDHH
jgi:hypothetical protein